MYENKALSNKCILVTGASRGIGAGIAKTLAAHGARVALTYASNAKMADEICSSLPGEGHLTLHMNVADPLSVQSGFETVLGSFERLDGLVNNAGITKDQLILRMKDEDFDAVIQANLKGTYLCSKAAVKVMLKARKGSIVNISSVVASMGNPGQSNYAASKGGIEAFSRSLAKEVASRQIRVNCIAPGFIVTDMTDQIDVKVQDALKANIPLGRFGTVDDIAHASAYLLGDQASYITGHILHVNGGLHM